MFRAIISIIILFCFVIFSVPGLFFTGDTSTRFLESQGYINIELIERDLWFVVFKAGPYDMVIFDFKVTNPAGKEAVISTSEGIFKGATMRGY